MPIALNPAIHPPLLVSSPTRLIRLPHCHFLFELCAASRRSLSLCSTQSNLQQAPSASPSSPSPIHLSLYSTTHHATCTFVTRYLAHLPCLKPVSTLNLADLPRRAFPTRFPASISNQALELLLFFTRFFFQRQPSTTLGQPQFNSNYRPSYPNLRGLVSLVPRFRFSKGSLLAPSNRFPSVLFLDLSGVHPSRVSRFPIQSAWHR
ncbi:hypothetical protein DM02DRAFT_285238 [Periconia macrospinosa]|uniref:Uncharacterized protein n=1 Tax=Periconia macrospinosa TaxID=97972 RepID=A0A2V1EE88_9PLEO|nr:hypothetical protein DM02DRAFT_285238 [Periconia macrospinosa]